VKIELEEGRETMLISIHTPPRDMPPLRRLRFGRGLSIKELCASTGLSPNTIYRLETGGRTSPTTETLNIIADFYDLEVEQILEMVPPPPAPRKAIKEIRNTKGITGRDLAKLSDISYRTFLRAQRGEPVGMEVIERIANVLKVEPHVIAPDLYTPPLDPRLIAPPRILGEKPHSSNGGGVVIG
jgi:transcriptional regulator with XRE-family HTH domain